MTKESIHKWVWISIFIIMDKIVEFIGEHFTPKVNEDMNGMKVIFEPTTETVGKGTIWFEKAKRGWNKKPLSTNTYIIVDADLTNVLTFLNRYFNLNEENYHDIRRVFIDMGMDVMDRHLNGEE